MPSTCLKLYDVSASLNFVPNRSEAKEIDNTLHHLVTSGLFRLNTARFEANRNTFEPCYNSSLVDSF